MKLVRAFYERYGPGSAARPMLLRRHRGALRRGGFLNRVSNAIWPRPKPDQLVRRLFTSPEQLAAAADGILDAEEQRSSSGRGGAGASRPGAAGRGARASRRAGPGRGHLIVDEAQDLTPMQLRMLARRLGGSSDDPRRHRPVVRPVSSRRAGTRCSRTSHGDEAPRSRSFGSPTAYRAEMMDLALPLLDVDRARRRASGRLPVGRRAATDRASGRARARHAALREALALSGEDGLLAVILPAELDPTLAGALGVRRRHPGALAARGEGPRVRPGRRRRAEPDRAAGGRPSRALRRAHPADEDARRRPRAPAAAAVGNSPRRLSAALLARRRRPSHPR